MSDYIGELAEGEPILCPQCLSFDNARAISGFRTRGVGLLKSGVVLYGEEHNAGERVGAVTSRDLMRGRRPDLLIVAGTSLKVPGTKRLVKELSKVIKPPTRTCSDSGEEEDEQEEQESSSIKKPAHIHTIFLNNEFPAPCGAWKDTFDVWVKGNVDQFIQLVNEEKKVQEDLKIRKAQEKLERERKKEEKMKSQSTHASSRASTVAESLVPDPTASSKPRATTTTTAKPKKLILKVAPQSDSSKSAQTKAKPSVAGFFKTGKATVASQPTVIVTKSNKNPTTIKISKQVSPPTSKSNPTTQLPSTRKKPNTNNSNRGTRRAAKSS